MDHNDCHAHSTCNGGLRPTDIGASAYRSLYLYANGEVRSFYVVHNNTCAPGCGGSFSQVVKVHLYNKRNYCCEIGWVLFGHVANRIAPGGYNFTPNGLKIGHVPPDDGTCGYYGGTHSHMEAKSYSGVTLSRGSYSCDSYATQGSTIINNWSFNPSSYCPC
jgi:hypothetical protein